MGGACFIDFDCCFCCKLGQGNNDNTPTSVFESLLIIAPGVGIGLMVYLIIELGMDLLTFYSIMFLFLVFAILITTVLFALFFKYWRYKNIIETTKNRVSI